MANYDGLTRNAWPGTWSTNGTHPITLDTEQRGGLRYISGSGTDTLVNIPSGMLQDGMLAYVASGYHADVSTDKYYKYSILEGESRNSDTGFLPNASGNWSEFTTGGGVTASELNYVSGIAVYSSGQAIENESDIVAVSGIAAYASGNVGGGGDVTTAELNYVSGIAVYASGNLYVDNDAYVSGIATYASGQAVANESDIASNTSSISTNTSNISTNTSNISTNTARVNYASGQAIANESDIVAVSGIATKTFTVTAADSNNYTIDGMGLNSDTDPTIYLHKGHTYYFNKQTASHPFRVSTSNGGSAYQDADGNSIEISGQGVLRFEVPQDAPDKLYYYCTSHASMNGVIYTTNNSVRAYNNVTSDFSMLDSSDVVFIDTSSNVVSVTLPTAVGKGGQELLFKMKDGSNSGVLIGNGSETIDGDSVYPMYHKNQSISLISDNSNWYVT